MDLIRKYALREQREQQATYCQNCGNELTERGGDIASSGKIYCHGDNGIETACVVKALFNGLETGTVVNFYNPPEVQKAIRKRELTQFSPLERAVEDSQSPALIH